MIGDYRLGQVIGKGTFGKVFRAQHLPTGQLVAVKMLQKNKIIDRRDLKRIQHEIFILRKINHPNILRLYELQEDIHNIYIITQLVNGVELYTLITKHDHLEQQIARGYFKQLVDAVAYLHTNGICHRDIKPENIIVRGPHLKLIDFGLSNICAPNSRMTASCGSPCYAAPEMLMQPHYDARKVDAWAMGVTLYAMLKGRLPFNHNNTSKLYKIISKGQYQRVENGSQALRNMLQLIIEVNPDKRMPVQEMLQHPWLKQFIVPNFPSLPSFYSMPILKAMVPLFGISLQQLSNIVEEKKVPSIWTYYTLLAAKAQRMSSQCQQMEEHRGPIHIKYLYTTLEELKLSLSNKVKWCSQYILQFKGYACKIKRIKGSKSMVYLCMPPGIHLQ